MFVINLMNSLVRLMEKALMLTWKCSFSTGEQCNPWELWPFDQYTLAL